MQRPSRGAPLTTRQARTPSTALLAVWSTALLAVCALLGASCTRREPPTWDAGDEEPVAWPAGKGARPAPSAERAPLAGASSGAYDVASPPAVPLGSTAAPTDPWATGSDGGRPPAGAGGTTDGSVDFSEQTKDRPDSRSPAFEARARALFDAIVSDDPEKARAAFFPLAAYERVKDVAKPASDYRVRLWAAFKRDIHDYHVALKRPDAATFIEMRVPDERARWVGPGEEYNKLGYYRVFGSKLVVTDGSRVRELKVKSLISWRGEWYVVHLAAIE